MKKIGKINNARLGNMAEYCLVDRFYARCLVVMISYIEDSINSWSREKPRTFLLFLELEITKMESEDVLLFWRGVGVLEHHLEDLIFQYWRKEVGESTSSHHLNYSTSNFEGVLHKSFIYFYFFWHYYGFYDHEWLSIIMVLGQNEP